MNIDDVKGEHNITSTADLFSKQRELIEKYDKIEAKNGAIVPRPPYNLDSRIVQSRIKDLFWRVSEELSEAMEAIADHENELQDWKIAWDKKEYVRHFYEELSDALHFLIEASIVSNLTPDEVSDKLIWYIPNSFEWPLSVLIYQILYSLGIAANDFKNKPWKQTEVPTDVLKFKTHLLKVWTNVCCLLKLLNCTEQDMYSLYARKWEVNRWRQDTNY